MVCSNDCGVCRESWSELTLWCVQAQKSWCVLTSLACAGSRGWAAAMAGGA